MAQGNIQQNIIKYTNAVNKIQGQINIKLADRNPILAKTIEAENEIAEILQKKSIKRRQKNT